jgi:YgiT-type zinc finger domain-containing protein
MKCLFCGGDLKKEKVAFVYDEEGKYLAVENIPAEVCLKCGEKTYAPETTRELLNYARNHYRPAKTIAMPVFDFAEQRK